MVGHREGEKRGSHVRGQGITSGLGLVSGGIDTHRFQRGVRIGWRWLLKGMKDSLEREEKGEGSCS